MPCILYFTIFIQNKQYRKIKNVFSDVFICVKIVDISANLLYNKVDKMRKKEWSVHVMNMTPAKKIIIALVVVCVALTAVTANNLTSVMMLIAAKNTAANNSGNVVAGQQQTVVADNGGSYASGESSSGSSSGSSSSSSSSSSSISSTPSGGQTSDSSNGNSASTGKNNGSAPSTGNSGSADKGGNADAEQKDLVKTYVDAVNKAKSSAKTVVKTKTSASHYKEHLVIDGNALIKATLEPIGKGLMGTFMKASEPNETIDKSALPPQNIQCSLTAADVEKSESKQSGNNTVITLTLKGASDPKAGSGLGSAVSIIEEKTITDAVNGVIDISNIHLDYDACTVVATLDASGNLVGLSVNAPCILKLTAMGVNAEVGIECYDEYTIAY